MAKFTVFYKNQLEEECDELPPCIPSGALIRCFTDGRVYWARQVTWSKKVPVSIECLPNNIKAMCLLLNIQI